METTENLKFDKTKTAEAVVDGLQAAAYTGIQRPYEAIKQASHNIFHVDLPDSHIVQAPPKVSDNSAAGVAESIGTAVGMMPWIYASHKIVGSFASELGFSAEKALMSKSLSITRAGFTGATYSALFQPAQGKGNYFEEKAQDAGIAFATFATGAGINAAVKPLFGTFETRAANVGLSSSIGAISGVGAGVVNAELNNLSGREHVSPLRAGIEFGILGGAFGAKLAGETKTIGKQEMSSNELDERDIFGERPEKLLTNLDAIKSRYGENSPEHADYLIRIGDAHMTQGSLSNPSAQASYEQALKIFSDSGQSNAQMGKVYDKLANVKESSDDTRGAVADLARAIELWQTDQTNPDFVKSDYFVRREQDLRRLQGVNQIRFGRSSAMEQE